MAGDWLKMRHELDDDPRVLRIQLLLSVPDVDLVIGKLRRLWKYADQHTTDGFMRYVTPDFIDQVVRMPGFSTALSDVHVGWLEFSEEGARIPRFDEHNSESAKKRALTAVRVAKHRAKKVSGESCNAASVTSVTSALPEKRREEMGKNPHTPLARSSANADSGPTADALAAQPDRQSASPAASLPPAPGTPGPAANDDAVVLTFPTVGRGASEWQLHGSKLAEYRDSFPAVDVLAECRKALQWLRDTPRRRKTASGMPRFICGWLSRVQNRARQCDLPLETIQSLREKKREEQERLVREDREHAAPPEVVGKFLEKLKFRSSNGRL